MRPVFFCIASLIFLSFSAVKSYAETNVVVSIKPIHSLVAGVMEGVAVPSLIIGGAGSPHTYNMKPSEAKTLAKADIVFWIGEDLEGFLKGPIKNLASKARIVELSKIEGLTKHPYREGGPWDEHGHKHEHEHSHKHKHDHEKKEEQSAHGEIDMHLWLDPENAKVMVGAIVQTLKDVDAANAPKYEENGKKLLTRLDALLSETKAATAPLKGKPFIVFHDAYQYFEKRFDVTAAGSITVSPENKPSAKRIAKIKKKMTELNAACIFAEPQFEPKIVTMLEKETKAKAGVLDPLGAGIKDGPELYFDLIRNNVNTLKACLLK